MATMRKLLLGLVILLIGGTSLVFLSRVDAQRPPEENPEFYFTRLVYRQNGFYGGSNTMETPDPFICPEFGGGRFFPQQGWGWATDYPGGDCKFMGGVQRLTNARVDPNPNVIEIMDPNLFKYPYLYAVEVGQMTLNEKEAARIREYLLRGGFLHVDDFWGNQASLFVEAIEKVFPDRRDQLEKPLPMTHPIFHTFFDIDEVIMVPGRGRGCGGGNGSRDNLTPRIYGISDDDDRLMVLITFNSDLGDAWEYMDDECYPEKASSYAYRVGLNAMIYAMTH